jgi:3-hydroxyacyl-CoA dehydrogenase/enoyl-CoA hydratase/3-hydroxybutyryl-CoA epimerase
MSAMHVSVDTDGIALIAIDQPGRSLPVVTPALVGELLAAVERIAADPMVKGAVLTSTGPGCFLAGADRKALVEACERGVTAAQARDFSRGFQRLMRRMETCGKLFAAAINGAALGGGLELALGCHYRVLADDPAAVVGLPEVTTGLLPGGGGTQRLPRLIGVREALALMLAGTPVDPAQALKLGIVDALAPASEVVARARAWISSGREAVQPWDRKGFVVPGGAGPLSSFASQAFMAGVAQIRKQTQGHLPAPLAILSCVYEGTITDIDTGLKIEAKYFGQLLAGPIARNLMRTLFENKEAADRLERRPAGVPRSRVGKLGVLGAGMMGAGIAYVAASAGIEVVLLDITQAAADAGKAHSEKLLARALQRGSTTPDHAGTLLRRITTTTDYALLDGCDLVIEAVFESREVKRDVMQRAEAMIPVTALVASNTSTLPIHSLAVSSLRPAQLIGLHFFSPVDRMPLVEVIMSSQTSRETLARALDFVAQVKKTPIVVNDGPGFYTTRVFSAFIDEGACMLAEGVAPALIENAARLAGMPVGPLAQFDEVSLELSWRIVQQARADGLAEQYTRSGAAPVIEKMIALQRRGRRHGAGFYEYPQDGGKKLLWPGLGAHFPVEREQPGAKELEARFLTIQALEAARCIEEGVVTNAADADLGAVLGIGFPQWTGGTLSYIDTVGIQRFVADCERFASRYGKRYAPSAWLKARAAAGKAFHAPDAPAQAQAG